MCRLNSFSSSSLIRAQTPSPKRVPLGTTMPHRPGFAPSHGPPELAHDELQEEKRRLGGLLVFGKVRQDAPLLLAAEGRIGHDDVHAILVADLAQRKAEGVFRVNLRVFQAVEQEVHLAEQVRQRLGLDAEQRALLQTR